MNNTKLPGMIEKMRIGTKLNMESAGWLSGHWGPELGTLKKKGERGSS
jgi:hypothetical protein